MPRTVTCPYCCGIAPMVTGEVLYPHRKDLHEKKFYACIACDAYVGCHDGTDKPLGRLADAELRRWKSSAHAAFDPKWRSVGMKRRDAYKWLADTLGIDTRSCHIGMFDVAMCKKVVEVCKQASPKQKYPLRRV